MTRQEAIAILERLQEPEAWEPQISENAYTALQMAIDAINDVTDRNVGNKSGDTIYRQDAIRVVSGLDSSFVKYIEELPSAQPEPSSVRESDADHIWYKGKQFISLTRVNGMLMEHPKYTDIISRQMAIDALEKHEKTKGHNYFMFRSVVSECAEVIRDLPSAQPEQRWIPVSERLPEDEYVLISKLPTKISGNKWSVAIAIRTADPRSGKIQWRDSGFGVIQDDKVLAWMSLPSAYREEGDNV